MRAVAILGSSLLLLAAVALSVAPVAEASAGPTVGPRLDQRAQGPVVAGPHHAGWGPHAGWPVFGPRGPFRGVGWFRGPVGVPCCAFAPVAFPVPVPIPAAVPVPVAVPVSLAPPATGPATLPATLPAVAGAGLVQVTINHPCTETGGLVTC